MSAPAVCCNCAVPIDQTAGSVSVPGVEQQVACGGCWNPTGAAELGIAPASIPNGQVAGPEPLENGEAP